MEHLRNYFSRFFIATLIFITACKKDKPVPLPDQLTDVVYGSAIDTSGNRQDLTLDLYFPLQALNFHKCPLIVLLHGGSYLHGSKEDLTELCKLFAEKGFVSCTINYRLGWRNFGWNSDPYELLKAEYRGIQDLNTALRFLLSKSETYQIDANWIFTGGYSAGGAIALNGHYKDDSYILHTNPELIDQLGSLSPSWIRTPDNYSVKGICNICGSISDSMLIHPPAAVPEINFHGLKDQLVPADIGHFLGNSKFESSYGSVCIERQLNHYCIPNVNHYIVDGEHIPWEFNLKFICENTSCFFNGLRNNHQEAGDYYGSASSCN